MKFNEMLNDFRDKKTKCFINGMPSDEGGIIKSIEADYVVFEIVEKEDKKADKVEIIFIPLDKIVSLSEGEKSGMAAFLENKEKPLP